MTSQRVASRYAKSLVDMALERHQLDRIKEDVDSVLAMAKNRDFALLLSSPVINPGKKQSILSALLDKAGADELTKAFVRIVINKGREGDLVGILRSFNEQFKKLRHISTVKLTSATALDADTLSEIRSKLIAGGKTEANVDLDTHIDPSLLGGFILEFDGQIYDASVAHKLREMKKDLARPNLHVNNL